MVKCTSLTGRVPLILSDLSNVKVSGICGVAVKCIDTTRNIDSEGSLLGVN